MMTIYAVTVKAINQVYSTYTMYFHSIDNAMKYAKDHKSKAKKHIITDDIYNDLYNDNAFYDEYDGTIF